MLTRGGAFGQRRCRHIIRMWQAAGGVERGGEWEEWEDALLHNTMCMEGGMEGGMGMDQGGVVQGGVRAMMDAGGDGRLDAAWWR